VNAPAALWGAAAEAALPGPLLCVGGVKEGCECPGCPLGRGSGSSSARSAPLCRREGVTGRCERGMKATAPCVGAVNGCVNAPTPFVSVV